MSAAIGGGVLVLQLVLSAVGMVDHDFGGDHHGETGDALNLLSVRSLPGLRLPEPGADPDRHPAQGRALDGEHPRQRAQRLHGRHRHRAVGDAERGRSACSAGTTDQIKQAGEDIIFGQLRQVIASMRSRRSTATATRSCTTSRVAGAGAEEDRPGADQREHHRHHRRVGVHRGHRPKAAARRSSRPAATWPSRRRWARSASPRPSATSGPGRQRRTRAEIGTREAEREQAVRSPSWTRSRRSASRRPPSSASRGQGGRARQAHRVASADAKAIAGETRRRPQIAASQAELQVKRGRGLPGGRDARKREAEAAVQEAQNRAMAKAASPRPSASRPSARRAGSPRQGREGPHHRRRRGRGREAQARGQAEAAAIYAKLEAEARGQYEILAKKGEGLQADRRRLRRRAGGLPAPHARAPGPPGRDGREGHQQHQVRQGGGLGRRRR
jgi:hypothetical protein